MSGDLRSTGAHGGALDGYRSASERASDQVIRAYSTSFGAATRLLGARHRTHVRNIYALVRVADELVDGVASEAGLSRDEQSARLDALERETDDAIRTGYSSNPIVQAFAGTARASGIDGALTAPFFASMRTDLDSAPGGPHERPAMRRFDADAHADYVYGSAEVVGLMCLRVFLRDEPVSAADLRTLERGARSLGAAFQNVNFLRDVADDTERLQRGYLGTGEALTEAEKRRWIETIRAQLADARGVLPLLPADARRAVACAWLLFARLTDRIERTPLDELFVRRVSVPVGEKAVLVLRAIVGAGGRVWQGAA
ncbi:phytoene synthase [Leucobacter zeae]|nr:phytoene synthase [Leucobacter zeae]